MLATLADRLLAQCVGALAVHRAARLTRKLLQVDSWRKVRRRMALPMDARGSDAQEMAAMAQALTREQLQQFVALCRRRYLAKRIDPGGPRGSV